MVGHTGVYDAIVKAVKAVDGCVAKVVEAAKENGYEVVMIADHGNADNAINPDGTPNTAHSLNPVPFIYVTANKQAKVGEMGIFGRCGTFHPAYHGVGTTFRHDGPELDKRLILLYS